MKYEVELKINGVSNIKVELSEEQVSKVNDFIKNIKEA